MIKKILVANRGEIAVRIIQACNELNIKTVTIFSEPDRHSLHVKMADEAYCVGPANASDSYLNMENILRIASITNVDAIHPGYGFLAENDTFVSLCEKLNIKFIGPTANTVKEMGLKDEARRLMKDAGIPVTPGSDGIIHSIEEAREVAHKIGYPIIIKATSGGGGRGIRVVHDENDLQKYIKLTQKEAEITFGNPNIYIEKYIEDFRHIEVQVLADSFGNIIHLGERDCTIQRRMQKLVEETPSPVISDKTREKMGKAAVKAAKAVSYIGAGTVEFIYDYRNDLFYFMEMNTRLQVEHPVTEMVTGIDIVKEQIKIANDLPLSYSQEDIFLDGWSIECRINAENPYNDFMPSAGEIDKLIVPSGPGIRVDSSIYAHANVLPFYDSLIAKLIVHGKNRKEAISKMKSALKHFKIEGIHTTIPFFQTLMNDDTFERGQYNTNFLEDFPFISSSQDQEV